MIGKYVPKLGIFYLDELSMTSCRDATGMMVIGLGESSLNGSARLMIITGLWQPQPKDAGKLSLNPGFQLISTSNEKSLSCFSIFFWVALLYSTAIQHSGDSHIPFGKSMEIPFTIQ